MRVNNERDRPEHYTGAACENIAAAYYILQHSNVMWPSVQQSVIDFMADDKRIQVKKASWSKSQVHRYLQCRTRLTNRHNGYKASDLYDELFVVSDVGCWRIPSDQITSSNLSLLSSCQNPSPSRTKRVWDNFFVGNPLDWLKPNKHSK